MESLYFCPCFECSQDKDIISAISMTNSRFAGKIYFIQIYFGDGMYNHFKMNN